MKRKQRGEIVEHFLVKYPKLDELRVKQLPRQPINSKTDNMRNQRACY